MNGNSLVVDSNIIIYLSKNQISFDDVFSKHDFFYLSIITYIEVLGFNFRSNDEKTVVTKFLSNFEILNVTQVLAERVIEIRKVRKIKLPDAIILATAQATGSDLMTKNIADFNNIDPQIHLIDPMLK